MYNLARWKRWSREFLPPDPLGGMQSGYARQYHPDQAFRVHLGGHLVAELKFTIPEAKRILKDVDDWLAANGFYFDVADQQPAAQDIGRLIDQYVIFIKQNKSVHANKPAFFYTVRGVISNQPAHYKGFDIREERYAETFIGAIPETFTEQNQDTVKMLCITRLHKTFVENLELDKHHYKTLS